MKRRLSLVFPPGKVIDWIQGARCWEVARNGTEELLAERIIGMLREAVRLSHGEEGGAICRGLSISEQRYRWRYEYDGLKLTQAMRLKALENENARLKKAVSDLTLDALILKK